MKKFQRFLHVLTIYGLTPEGRVTVPELLEGNPVGESLSADPDALQHTVAGELMHHQGRVEQQGGLVVVGHNAADEVGIGQVEGGQ